jgi:hypothetical protein
MLGKICVTAVLTGTSFAATQTGFVNTDAVTKYASWSVVASLNGSLRAEIGVVQKHASNPLLVQDQPWEMRLDNAYPNVVHDPADRTGHGAYRLWYGGFIACKDCATSQGSDRVNAWHYANSSDGLAWTKPPLGIFNLTDCTQCSAAARAAGTANNVLMSGDGMGIYHDAVETNRSRTFKAFGTGCFGAGGTEGCVSGVGVSADGLRWTDPLPLKWPAPQRYDCHQNMVRDPTDGTFLLTTRDGFSSTPGRCIGIARGAKGGAFGGWDLGVAPALVEQGTDAQQLYSQVTFPYYNVWLGLVAVFDTQDASTVGTVHTRLSWSADTRKWSWLDSGGLTGRPFIPLGTPPPPRPCVGSWAPVLNAATGKPLSDCAAYRAGSRAAHTICDTSGRTQAPDRSKGECQAACSADASCQTMQWQGLEANAYDATKPGRCWFLPNTCAKQQPYDTGKLWKTFCVDVEACGRAVTRAEGEEEAAAATAGENPMSPPFDSHIIFSAHTPFADAASEHVRVYYMGGNGPHNGPRNTSLGLATLRRDGFGGLAGSGTATTTKLRVPSGGAAAPRLTVTADVLGAAGGSVRVGAIGVSGLDAASAVPLTANSTDAVVSFASGKTFADLAGQDVALEIVADSAMVYTIGFDTSA